MYPKRVSDDAPSAGRIEGRVHLLPVRIYYEDTDFTGLVYHANYLRYFERGRSDFLRLAGIHHSELLAGAEPLGFAVNRIVLDFLKPARIDDALVVRTAYESMRGPRIFIAQALERGGETLVRAEVEVCCISLTGRPRKPPALLSERLKPFLEPPRSSF
ncbi:MAG: YbgC/FadM family acyl-CoA thioesterase [Hyphomonadaceae bacterium]